MSDSGGDLRASQHGVHSRRRHSGPTRSSSAMCCAAWADPSSGTTLVQVLRPRVPEFRGGRSDFRSASVARPSSSLCVRLLGSPLICRIAYRDVAGCSTRKATIRTHFGSRLQDGTRLLCASYGPARTPFPAIFCLCRRSTPIRDAYTIVLRNSLSRSS